jgi:hypothetical protein
VYRRIVGSSSRPPKRLMRFAMLPAVKIGRDSEGHSYAFKVFERGHVAFTSVSEPSHVPRLATDYVNLKWHGAGTLTRRWVQPCSPDFDNKLVNVTRSTTLSNCPYLQASTQGGMFSLFPSVPSVPRCRTATILSLTNLFQYICNRSFENILTSRHALEMSFPYFSRPFTAQIPHTWATTILS